MELYHSTQFELTNLFLDKYLISRSVRHSGAFDLFQGEDIYEFILPAAKTVSLGIFGGHIRILERAMQLPEGMPLAEMYFHRERDILFDQSGLRDRIEHGLFHGNDVIGAEDAHIRQDRHAGKAEAVTKRGYLRGQVEMNGFAGLEGGHGLADGNGTGFHEGMEVGLVDLQASRRGHLQAAPALVALFHV